jgi:hypothetical protein
MDQREKTGQEKKIPVGARFKKNKKKIPGNSMWDLWWTKWHWDRFFPE